jgi:glycosyltransferase involved in cell wall biosynthesis
MKKIGLYLGSKPDGGEFQYCLTMLDALAALPDDRFSVVSVSTSDVWKPYLDAGNLKCIPVSSGFWGRALGLLWTRAGLPMGPWRSISPLIHPITRAMLREKCDLWIFPGPTAKSFQAPVPALVSIHDLMHRYERRFSESSSGIEYYNRERNLANICHWSHGILVDSETGKKQVHESYGMPPERIHVLPFTPPRYMYSTGVPPGFDDRYRLPDKFIFYPARFWEHKNHRRLVEAVGLLKRTLPDLKLVLAGSRQNASAATVDAVTRCNLVDAVQFLGHVPDHHMPELYRRARAMVMPTFYGPTNIPPLEAFVAGCPAAVSAIYAMPEQVGDAALLFNPESTREIADCIARLWSDDNLCEELARKGRTRAAAWGQPQFNERFREILDRIVGPGNHSHE